MKQTVLLTGASGDIGKALAKSLIQNHYSVIGIYHKDVTSIQSLTAAFPKDFHAYACDLSDFHQVAQLFAQLSADHHEIDVLIHNAGISVVGLLQDMDADTWHTLWNTNVTSAVALAKYAIPMFLKKGHGKIINISSVWGERGASCEAGYSATKGALNSLTKALAKELAPSNIQVNALSCGMIDTKMNAHLSAEDRADIAEEIPACHIGTPEDVADALIAVLHAGSYMTGQIIGIDGGWQV